MVFGKPRFFKYMFCFDITKDKINAHFLAMAGPLEAAFKSHKQRMLAFYKLLVYTKLMYYPDDLIASNEILSKARPRDRYDRRYVHQIFKPILLDLEAKLVESEKRNHIGRLAHADKQCLEWFNSQYCTDHDRWSSLKSLRRYFKAENREFLIDHFIFMAKEFRCNIYDSLMEDLYITTTKFLDNHIVRTEMKVEREHPKLGMPRCNVCHPWFSE